MKLKNLSGRYVYKNVNSKRIDWGKKSRSKIQFSVKEILHDLWKNDIVYEEFPVYGTRLSLDFYNATLDVAIEVQGAQHTSYNKFFHGGNQAAFIDQLRRDRDKDEFCEMNEIKLVKIFEKEKRNISVDFVKDLIDNCE